MPTLPGKKQTKHLEDANYTKNYQFNIHKRDNADNLFILGHSLIGDTYSLKSIKLSNLYSN